MEQKIILKEVSKDTIDNLIEVLNKLQSTIGDDIVNIEISECDEKYKIVVKSSDDLFSPLKLEDNLTRDSILKRLSEIHFEYNLLETLQFIDDNTRVIRLAIPDEKNIIDDLKKAVFITDELMSMLSKPSE